MYPSLMLPLVHWNRALLLATLNVAAAAPMMLLLESRFANEIRNSQQSGFVTFPESPTARLESAMRLRLQRVQEDQAVGFDPCRMWTNYRPQQQLVAFGNIPAEFLAEWGMECPPAWSVEGRIVGTRSIPMTRDGLVLRRRADLAFLVLIAVEWLLIGAFPLRQAARFYGEPGSFITACTLLGSALALIHPIDSLARIPAICAAFGWVWWLGVLLWIVLRFSSRAMLKLRR